MAAAALAPILARLGADSARHGRPFEERAARVLVTGWEALDAVLPDGGLPRGVVELAAPAALGGATSIALAAARAAHLRDARAWCAWIHPEGTLYAPAAVKAGVDLARLLVVRPPRADLARIAVKVASAQAFDLVVVDVDPIAGAGRVRERERERTGRGRRPIPPEILVRKLALAAEEGGTTILLVTNGSAPRAAPWPVALRLDLAQRANAIAVRVAKDRRGRGDLGPPIAVPWPGGASA